MLKDHCRMKVVIPGANSADGEHLTEIIPSLFVIFCQFCPINMIALSSLLINGEHFSQCWIV